MSLASQEAENNSELQAFLSGQFHTAYGLLAIAGLAVAAFVLPGKDLWAVYLFIFGLSVGVLVDIWAHGYTH